MKKSKRLALTLLLVFAVAVPVHAQDGGPIRILVGFPPGGASDQIVRLIQDKMKDALGASVIIENRAGGNGTIAAEALKNAAPNGKTLMIAPIGVIVFSPLTQSNLRYDPFKDFAPVSLAANFRIALTIGPGTPAKTLEEYIAWVKVNRAKATYGVPVAGGLAHFFGVMLAQATGLDLAVVPYKGGGPLAIDLMGGQIPTGFNVLSEVIKQHQSGKVRILAVSGSERSPVAPDIPSFRDRGFAAMQAGGWQAFFVPAKTPRQVIDRISGAIAAAIKSPDIYDRLLTLGLEPVGSTADELARRMAEDAAHWAPAVKASGFRADQ
jgi:tripartite-type tricarboxylate transporter receptor subunit TctC